MTIFNANFLWQFSLTIVDYNFWWQFLMTIFDDNLWWQFLMTIFDDNIWWQYLITICDDNFWWQFLMTIETIFDNWKDSPGDLTFETLITILTIENLNSDNYSYLTINCDTGQHSQSLRCFFSTRQWWSTMLRRRQKATMFIGKPATTSLERF